MQLNFSCKKNVAIIYCNEIHGCYFNLTQPKNSSNNIVYCNENHSCNLSSKYNQILVVKMHNKNLLQPLIWLQNNYSNCNLMQQYWYTDTIYFDQYFFQFVIRENILIWINNNINIKYSHADYSKRDPWQEEREC